MSIAARAIIIENGKLLVMRRNKYGSEYYTLVGGRVNDSETPDQALVREVQEETGMAVVAARLVYMEEHAAPYNSQYIYLCEVAPHAPIGLEFSSEEANMNSYGMNMHEPTWVPLKSFEHLPFRTPQLHEAISKAIKKGKMNFPAKPIKL